MAAAHSRTLPATRDGIRGLRRGAIPALRTRVYSSLHRQTLQFAATRGDTEMDALNTFFVFNISASIVVMIAFLTMRDGVAAGVENLKARVSSFNFAGAGGAATSLVLLASVASLFR